MNVEKLIKLPGLPLQGSDVAVAWDNLYWFLIWVSVFFFVAVIGAMLYFAVQHRAGKGHKTKYIVDNHKLEAFWTVIPTILLLVIFAWGWKVYTMMVHPPADAMEIRVVGKQWYWTFQYEDGRVLTHELYVPQNKPVKLIMSSDDVLHSFFVPAMRVKQDVVPGIYTSVWFEAKVAGEHQVYCTEYCGTEHSLMLAKLKVLEPEKWEQWRRGKEVEVTVLPGMAAAAPAPKMENLSLPEKGKEIVQQKGCMTCHRADDQATQLAPAWKGVYGSERVLKDDSKVVVDDAYIRESIMTPTAKIVKGFNPVMPPYQGQISETELNAIIAYIKSLK